VAFAVVIGAIVQCSHGGKSRLRAGNAKLKVNDAAVVTAGMEVGVPFLPFGSPPTPDNPAPCTKQAPGTPPPPSPCTATLAATPEGVSTKITVDGIGVLLDTASGKATNTNDPDANWIISDAGQAVLRES
jgi:hypothetical protein